MQKFWEFKLNEEVKEFIIDQQAKEMMQQLHNGEIIPNNDSDSDSGIDSD